MAQHYSNPKRESDPYALPDLEVWYHTEREHSHPSGDTGWCEAIAGEDAECLGVGWYWRVCFPGCLPETDPRGTFATEADALADKE